MAKSNGGTRASASNSPTGLQSSGIQTSGISSIANSGGYAALVTGKDLYDDGWSVVYSEMTERGYNDLAKRGDADIESTYYQKNASQPGEKPVWNASVEANRKFAQNSNEPTPIFYAPSITVIKESVGTGKMGFSYALFKADSSYAPKDEATRARMTEFMEKSNSMRFKTLKEAATWVDKNYTQINKELSGRVSYRSYRAGR